MPTYSNDPGDTDPTDELPVLVATVALGRDSLAAVRSLDDTGEHTAEIAAARPPPGPGAHAPERIGALETELAARTAELEAAQAERAELQRQLAAKAERVSVGARAPVSARELGDHDVAALREENAALAAYIDGRGTWWRRTEAELARLATRVVALEHELRLAAERLARAEALAARESQRASELRATAAAHARQARALEQSARASRAAAAEQPAPAAPPPSRGPRASAPARPAPSAPPPPAAASTDAPPDGAQPTSAGEDLEMVTQLQSELDYKRQQVAAQLVELHDRESRLTRMAGDLERARRDLLSQRAEIDQLRTTIGRLEGTIRDKDRALDARGARIDALQSELAERLGALRKLNEMDLSLQGLDSQMSARLPDTQAERTTQAPVLVCLTGDGPTRAALERETTTIGRAPHCDIQITTHFVSREHARIRRRDGAVTIEDLGSRNGILVNAVRVERTELRQGDIITVGETQFRYVESVAH